MIRTGLMGWKKYKNHPDPCVKDRIHWQSNELGTIYAGVMWVIKKWYNNDMHMVKKMDAILRDIYQEFGLISRILAPLIGRLAFFTIQRESKRLKEGWTYEPPTIYEKNDRARALENSRPFPAVIRTIPAFNFNDRLVPTFDVMQRMKTLYYTFRDSRFKRAASKATPVSRDAPLLITPDILKIEIRKTNNGHHPLSVDLYGSFNRITAGRLGKSMKRYLKMHDGGIGINFRHLDFINRNSLLGFLRKLRVFGSRITFSGFNVIQSHFADEAAYVTKYFKVIKKVNQELPATGIDT
jgi:hypothetical protein